MRHRGRIRTHIYDMNVLESRERKVFEDLASESTCSNNQYLGLAQRVVVLIAGIGILVEGTLRLADMIQVFPPGGSVAAGIECHLRDAIFQTC